MVILTKKSRTFCTTKTLFSIIFLCIMSAQSAPCLQGVFSQRIVTLTVIQNLFLFSGKKIAVKPLISRHSEYQACLFSGNMLKEVGGLFFSSTFSGLFPYRYSNFQYKLPSFPYQIFCPCVLSQDL